MLRELLRLLPEEEYLYFSDNAHCPYGEKSQGFILGRCRSIVEDFLSQEAQAVVIACNTATAAAIATLREEYPDIPFVGMEPAIKPAILATRNGIIGVLATESTLHSAKYIDTRERYAQGVRVVEHVGEGFVELVESLDLDSAHTREVVDSSLRPLLQSGVDTVVLGCTHYPFLLDTLKQVMSELAEVKVGDNYLYRDIIAPDFTFIDPAIYTAIECYNSLRQDKLLALKTTDTKLDAYISVPAYGLPFEKIDNEGNLTYDFKYGREVGTEDVTTLFVPFSRRYINSDNLKRIEARLPYSYKLINEILK